MHPSQWGFRERPRALIENGDGDAALAQAELLRRAGYAVAICAGPNERERCPLVMGEPCALVAGADVVVCSLGHEHPEVPDALRAGHPELPIYADAAAVVAEA